ncbi:AMP-binding protein [Bradyrhizobium sp. 190]|uniref:phenylacetate--CoA ligase family protein n=1 Tax=Bradyrhizobium sp. 190 TaxID=2782658 RepID=UPI001FF760B3|nr:AMP-binding protein [Bradyrhizobium sp. 190]MCK1515035.1 AMP-binding protein [Bradyrhizobium sp. 190]
MTLYATPSHDATIPQLADVIARALVAPAWRTHLGPTDPASINCREALATLPVLRKSDLPRLQKSAPPFGGFEAQPTGEWGRLFLSPGPIFEPEPEGPDAWGAASALAEMGLRRADVVLNTFSYHMSPGGFLFDSGARSLGCAVIPAGPGNTEQQLELIAAYRPNVFIGTADFLNILLEIAAANGVDTSCIRTAIVSGAAFPKPLRERFAVARIDAREVYAAAEVGIIAYAVSDRPELIVSRDLIVEIVDPNSGIPVAPEDTGEVVVTCLRPRRPIIRLALGDLSAFHAVTPGERLRLRGWLGRVDQATKIKGMFVRPEQIREVQSRHPEVQRLRLVVQRVRDVDSMTLHAEAAIGSSMLPETLATTLAAITKLRGRVELHSAGSLPEDGKLIVDER